MDNSLFYGSNHEKYFRWHGSTPQGAFLSSGLSFSMMHMHSSNWRGAERRLLFHGHEIPGLMYFIFFDALLNGKGLFGIQDSREHGL